ncbi:MAG: hypothetical protein KGP29_04070 [Proteobacteria bacterium]|nr:hypothetical protein [Pseudomonadota bacterium]
MHNILAFLTFRTVIIFASTAFSLAVVMLLLNIITIDELALILKLSPEATNALRLVFSRIQEVTGNIMDIIGQLLNKLFGWAGVDVDLSKIKVDLHDGSAANGAAQNPPSGMAPGRVPLNPNPQQ